MYMTVSNARKTSQQSPGRGKVQITMTQFVLIEGALPAKGMILN